MAVPLNTIRYYTQDSPYHYTSDNQPLQDLEQNDIALKAAVDSLQVNTLSATGAGNWTTLKLIFNLQPDINHQFAYKVKIWAIQDQSLLAGQASTLMEYSVIGYNLNPGNVNVSSNTLIYRTSAGAGTLVPVFTGNGNNLEVTFTGYTGTNGYVLTKLERFGF